MTESQPTPESQVSQEVSTVMEVTQASPESIAVNPNDASHLGFIPQETVMSEAQSNPNTSEMSKSTYERLAQANTPEEKQKILDEEMKSKSMTDPKKLGSLQDLINQKKTEAYADIDATLNQMKEAKNPAAPVEPEVVEVEPPAPEEGEFDINDETYEQVVLELEGLREFKAETELQNRVKENYQLQLENKLTEVQAELLDYKSSAVVLKDDVENTFLQSKRAYDNDKSDSSKYYMLYTIDKILQPLGITIKQDIDAIAAPKNFNGQPSMQAQRFDTPNRQEVSSSRLAFRAK